jgi:hypothetical protein
VQVEETGMTVKSVDLNDELGRVRFIALRTAAGCCSRDSRRRGVVDIVQVEYIFSDKTGTLTENIMVRRPSFLSFIFLC